MTDSRRSKPTTRVPDSVRGLVEVTPPAVLSDSPALRATGLPPQYIPRVAGYAGGPWLDPELVTPSEWNWRNARTYVVRHSDGLDYRAVMVYELVYGDYSEFRTRFAGYWAVELLGTPLTLPEFRAV